MLYLPLIARNTVRNRRRSSLTVFSIAASFCMLGVLMAMYSLFYLTPPSPDSAVRMIMRNRISLTNPLPISYGPRIRQVEGVREVMIYQWFGGMYKDSRDFRNFFPRFAVEPLKLFIVHPEFEIPEDQKQAFLRERTACIAGRALAERLNFKVGDRITLVGDIFNVTLQLTVRGIYDSRQDNDNLFFHFDYLNEAQYRGNQNWVSMFVILADQPESVSRISHDIDAAFRNSTTRTKTEGEKTFMLTFLSYLGNVKAFLLAVCASLTLTVLMVSANTMAMSVRERVKEVGILKTLGFTTGMILRLILGESLAIASLGGAIGLAVAAFIVEFIRRAPTPLVDMRALAISPRVGLACTALAALVGLLSSLVPAWNASRRPILESLRLAD
jgi:putative ABC transport system permease protein